MDSKRLSSMELITILTDMLIIGINSTTSTLAFTLYNLAKSPSKQEKLFKEIHRIMPKKDCDLKIDNLEGLVYLKACIRESLR